VRNATSASILADPETREIDGDTALMRVSHYTTKAVKSFIEMLIKYGADITSKNNMGETALHQAAKRGRLEAATVLLENSAEIDARDNYHRTPLMMAAANCRNAEVIDLLVEKGADLTLKERTGKTALELAKANGKKGKAGVEALSKHLEPPATEPAAEEPAAEAEPTA